MKSSRSVAKPDPLISSDVVGPICESGDFFAKKIAHCQSWGKAITRRCSAPALTAT